LCIEEAWWISWRSSSHAERWWSFSFLIISYHYQHPVFSSSSSNCGDFLSVFPICYWIDCNKIVALHFELIVKWEAVVESPTLGHCCCSIITLKSETSGFREIWLFCTWCDFF
jgi:hypothetical protein